MSATPPCACAVTTNGIDWACANSNSRMDFEAPPVANSVNSVLTSVSASPSREAFQGENGTQIPQVECVFFSEFGHKRPLLTF